MTTPDNMQRLSNTAEKTFTAEVDKSGFVLKFENEAVTGLRNDPNLVISYAVDNYPDTSKLIFHIKGISAANMAVVGEAMYEYCLKVLHTLPTNVRVEASESPVYRNQWDFLVWGIPTLRASELKSLTLKTLKEALHKANK